MADAWDGMWSLVSMRGRFQVDGNACGIWIQVARDLFIEYVDSHEFGTCTFEAFLHRRLKEQGVLPTERLSGLTLKAAMQTNQKFILEQRADMRGRLVQAAIAGKLAFSEAQLGGFAQELASRKPVEELDDIVHTREKATTSTATQASNRGLRPSDLVSAGLVVLIGYLLSYVASPATACKPSIASIAEIDS